MILRRGCERLVNAQQLAVPRFGDGEPDKALHPTPAAQTFAPLPKGYVARVYALRIAGLVLGPVHQFVPVKKVREWVETFHLRGPRIRFRHKDLADASLKTKMEEVRFNTANSKLLYGLYAPPATADKPVVLLAPGMGSVMAVWQHSFQPFLEKGYGLLAFDYRGQGNNRGLLTEQTMLEDQINASNYLATARKIPLSRQILVGNSLGTGVAANVASSIGPFKAVVMKNPFVSGKTYIKNWHDGLKNSKTLWHRLIYKTQPDISQMQSTFDSVAKMPKIQSPLLIIRSEKDIFPPEQAQNLLDKAASTRKKLVTVPGYDHDSMPASVVVAEIEKFMAEPASAGNSPT